MNILETNLWLVAVLLSVILAIMLYRKYAGTPAKKTAIKLWLSNNYPIARDWIIDKWGKAIIWARSHSNAVFWIVFAVIAVPCLLIILRGCSSTPVAGTPSPGAGWLFLKLAFAGLIWAVFAAREKEKMSGTFTGLAVLVLLVLLGKLDSLLPPLMAAAGIWGSIKTEGRIKSFLGFASGVLILFWMYLLYLEHSDKINIGFMGTMFPSDTEKIIATLFLAILAFAIWKRSIVFYAISFIVLLSFLGNTMINEIAGRFPEKLTPPATGISEGVESLLKSGGKAMKRLSEKWDESAAAPAPQSSTPMPDKISQRELEKETLLVATLHIATDKGENMKTYALPAGTYKISPQNSEVRIEGKWSSLENGVLCLSDETAVGFFPPRGTRTVSIYREKESG